MRRPAVLIANISMRGQATRCSMPQPDASRRTAGGVGLQANRKIKPCYESRWPAAPSEVEVCGSRIAPALPPFDQPAPDVRRFPEPGPLGSLTVAAENVGFRSIATAAAEPDIPPGFRKGPGAVGRSASKTSYPESSTACRKVSYRSGPDDDTQASRLASTPACSSMNRHPASSGAPAPASRI